MAEEKASVEREASAMAFPSSVFSLLSILIGPFGSIPGIVRGHLARRACARNPRLEGRGMALAGLIVGYLTLVGWIGILLSLPRVSYATAATIESNGVSVTVIKPGGPTETSATPDGVMTLKAGATTVTLDHMTLLVNGVNYGAMNRGDKVQINPGVVTVNSEKRSA